MKKDLFTPKEVVMAEEKITGIINDTESFGAVDGPGIRFIVFMQGCHMRCRYCHNPETWALTGGTERTPEDVLKQALRYKTYWKNGGGITVSGGEALVQIDFVTKLFQLCKEQGINTCLDTSGNPFTRKEPFFSKFKELMKVTDLVMLDIKQIDNCKHKELTGWTNENILDMARYMSDNGIRMWIRHVLVPGITTNEEDLKKLAEFIKTLKTVDKVEVLPYHSLGIPKYDKLGIDYSLRDTEAPSDEEIDLAESILGIKKA